MVKLNGEYKLTPAAISCLKKIVQHTEINWGVKQRDKYVQELYDCFYLLAKNPHLGKDRSEINPEYRSMTQGSHVVFYVIKKTHIDIIDIPHDREDIENVFGNSSGR